MRTIPAHLLPVLMLGTVSQLAQVVLLRELLMVFHGNELSIGIILAAWMAWVAIGSGLGAAIAERTDRVLSVLLLNAAALLPLLAITVLLIRGLRGFFDVLPGAYLSLPDIVVSSLLVVAPACLLIGMQFVLLAKLWRRNTASADTTGAGKTYVGEAAGNILGGIAFTFLLVHTLDSFQTVMLAGILTGAAVLWASRRTATTDAAANARLRATVMGLLIAAGIATFLLPHLDRWAYDLQWRHLAPDHELIETHQSRYGNIAIARRDDQYSFFRSGHLMFSTAGPETTAAHFEEQEAAVFAHFAMVQHPQPEQVLLIGGGLRGTLAEIVRHPGVRVDYVELDAILTRAARPYVSDATRAALHDPRVRLIHADGRVYLKETPERYDLVLVDVPDPATAVLNRYYTQEFFAQVQRRLNPGGILVIGAVSTPGLRGPAVANRNATLQHTLARVYPQVLPVGDRFLIFLASGPDGRISADPNELQQRYRERGVRSPGFSEPHFHLLLEESKLRRINWILRHHGRSPDAHLVPPAAAPFLAPPVSEQQQAEPALPPVSDRHFVNSDFRPIGYFYTLMFWGEQTRTGHAETLERLLQIESWWILPPIAAVFVLALLLRVFGRRGNRRPDRQFAVGFAVFTTGLSTMTLQIALLFSFQSIYGFIYEMVGLIIAIFMAGLALGTALTQRYVKHKASTGTLAAVQLTIAVFATLIAVVLPHAAGVESASAVFLLFSGLTFVSGLLNGLDFPLATESFRALNRRAERSAGMVYGIELAGACLGAALASAVVAPILGIVACCLLAAIVNTTAFAVLTVSRSRNER
ncbi:fused MFS/spermidine synthase [Thioalkalivibrio paradoxus]|uniref:Polyamine aminopropyltransferase n=1 Tax=Thioalkalivibrio paradoxus ARh 1 TaxID=713585 RepID=W0DK09_9GAMM|nr:fused MFS/spermidine synthase [Thioalkalivibrio paradoxus]AHE98944.1 spermine synthase [Thioalkalivibrio paradoxus ARh 1]